MIAKGIAMALEMRMRMARGRGKAVSDRGDEAKIRGKFQKYWGRIGMLYQGGTRLDDNQRLPGEGKKHRYVMRVFPISACPASLYVFLHILELSEDVARVIGLLEAG